MNWPKLRRRQQPTNQQQIIELHHGITADLWQQRPDYIKWARELFHSPMGSQLLSALRNEMPVPLKPLRSEFDLGRVVGFNQALMVLARLASDPMKAPDDIPVTYTEETEGE